MRSVYVHWPFCPYKCHFCPFVALASHDQFMQQYHAALTHEIKQFGQMYTGLVPLNTVYFGGGTPSTYPDELLLDMFATLKNTFGINVNAEVTIEVNPGTVRSGQLALWKQVGINRLSIGVQSLNDAVLKGLNRHQSASDVRSLLEQASLLFDNISIDLILGLPGVSDAEWYALIEQVSTWPIQHLSVYFLTVHEDTPLYFRTQRKELTLVADDVLVDLYAWTQKALASYGFAQYEVSSFARPGYESRHNQMYWKRIPYKGFGLGACSFDGLRRMQNEKNLMRYMTAAQQGETTTAFCELLTREQVYFEKIMLGLRQKDGIVHGQIVEGLTQEECVHINGRIAELQGAGLLADCEGRIVLTSKGLAVENAVAVHLTL